MPVPIKFRAWDVSAHCWYDGGATLVVAADGRLGYNHVGLGAFFFEPGYYLVSQFTGLHDRNGVEIFEGDVVERVAQIPMHPGAFTRVERSIVRWYEIGFEPFLGRATELHGFEDWSADSTKVIGNIFESPALADTPA